MTIHAPGSSSGTGTQVDIGNGDVAYIATGVSIVETSPSYVAVEVDFYGDVDVEGSVFGETGIGYLSGEGQPASHLTVGSGGYVGGAADGCSVDRSLFYLDNSGTIAGLGAGTGLQLSTGTTATIENDGTITGSYGIFQATGTGSVHLTNHGAIRSATGLQAISIGSSGPSDIYNSGLITGSVTLGSGGATLRNDGVINGALALGSSAATVLNNGVITGSVTLGTGVFGASFDSSLGRVFGAIATAGNAGATVVAGENGGDVVGGVGNDNFQANRSQAAADNAAQFVLDGREGSNALYGGGAFNTFDAGDASGGHNQIHGGLSKMSDVAGYANNKVDFSGNHSVYVDLLNGHDAYLYANTNHSGALTFEDSIQNVPNVIGSYVGDLIIADNQGDTVQGGGGSDLLYAGAGADRFVYASINDSNLVDGYDKITGFATGKDRLDLSAFDSDPSHLLIASSSSSTTFYLEQTAGHFNANTDLAISFAGANAIKASDVIF